MYEDIERFKVIPNKADAALLAFCSGYAGAGAVATLVAIPKRHDRELIDYQIGAEKAMDSTLDNLQLDLAADDEATTGVSNAIAAQRTEIHQTILELEASKPEPVTSLEWSSGVFGAIGVIGALVTAVRYHAHRKAIRNQNQRIGTDAPVIN